MPWPPFPISRTLASMRAIHNELPQDIPGNIQLKLKNVSV